MPDVAGAVTATQKIEHALQLCACYHVAILVARCQLTCSAKSLAILPSGKDTSWKSGAVQLMGGILAHMTVVVTASA